MVFPDIVVDTKYYYRTRYRVNGTAGSFLAGTEHSFHTQRAPGNAFTFAIEADPHLDTNSIPAAYTLTLQNILAQKPDFLLDLGDSFMSEKLAVISQDAITQRHLLYRPYFNEACHSVHLYLVIGNHEGELGWRMDGIANSLQVMAVNTRKLYYPNPSPDSFYSGDTVNENFTGLRESYYSWEWGNALFIVLDPYSYTVKKPDWGWTLGEVQYNWFKHLISNSKARFKFVFCHQLVGGRGNDARGGTEYAGFFEMGGYNLDNSWGFDSYRPGWEKPIHQLFADNGVNIFFHGHDHLFAREELDGVIYQEAPMPCDSTYEIGMLANADAYVSNTLDGSGHLKVTVSPECVRVDYVRAYLPSDTLNGLHHNREVAFSYSIGDCPSAGINDERINEQLVSIYPNPANDFLTMSLSPDFGDYQISLINPIGQTVLQTRSKYIDVSHYQNGLYLLNFKTATCEINKKIVISRQLH